MSYQLISAIGYRLYIYIYCLFFVFVDLFFQMIFSKGRILSHFVRDVRNSMLSSGGSLFLRFCCGVFSTKYPVLVLPLIMFHSLIALDLLPGWVLRQTPWEALISCVAWLSKMGSQVTRELLT